jgi:hypothetical protein
LISLQRIANEDEGKGKGKAMATEIRLRNPKTGDETTAYEGYSWTSLFFGAFPTLMRGDIALGLAVLGVTVVLGVGTFVAGYPTWLSSAIVGGIWGVFYNEIHFDRLRRAGYETVTEPPKAAALS